MIIHMVENRNRIVKNKCGFMKEKPCLINVLEFFELVTSRIEIREGVYVAYFDFELAFDKVPHSRF